MPLTVVVASAALATSLPLLCWAVAGTRREPTLSREVILGHNSATDLRTALLERSAQDRAIRPMLGRLARLGRRLTPYGRIEALEHRLTLAGRPAAWPIERVLLGKIVLGIVGFLVGFFFSGNRTLFWMLAWAGLTAIAYYTPDLLLLSRAQERQQAIGKALPDTLDQMTIAVEAGLGFESAMARAGQTGSGPLADELVRTLQEMQVGVPRSTALRNLAARTEQADLRRFVSAVVQAAQYGIPVADILRAQAAEQRDKRRQRAEEHAMKIPVKILFPLIVCIMPTLFIVLLGPAAIQLGRMFAGM